MNAALIAAAAAVAGGLLTAYATRSVEAMRVRAALVEKAEERRLASIERFLLTVNAWLDWLMHIEEQPSQDHYPELNRRVKERDDAYRELILLSSDRLHHWLVTVCSASRKARSGYKNFMTPVIVDRFTPPGGSGPR